VHQVRIISIVLTGHQVADLVFYFVILHYFSQIKPKDSLAGVALRYNVQVQVSFSCSVITC